MAKREKGEMKDIKSTVTFNNMTKSLWVYLKEKSGLITKLKSSGVLMKLGRKTRTIFLKKLVTWQRQDNEESCKRKKESCLTGERGKTQLVTGLSNGSV